MHETDSIKSRFQTLDSSRSALLERAREASRLTIPSLLPEEGFDDTTDLPTPYQGLGAQAVNNLSAKILMALVPPNAPFCRLTIPEDMKRRIISELGAGTYHIEVELRLTEIERAIRNYVETHGLRVPLYKAVRLLVTTGNACLFVPDEGGMRVYSLDQYVVVRDGMGNVTEVITKESVAIDTLPEEFREEVRSKVNQTRAKAGTEAEIYTHIVLNEEGKFEVTQEVEGESLQESYGYDKGEYLPEELPWIVLRWNDPHNSHYGRGHVDDYLGDFVSMESLHKSIVECAAILARILFLLNPNGFATEDDFIDAQNGDVIVANETDIAPFQVDKSHDLQFASSIAGTMGERISQAFLLRSTVQRNAERVTAEEIRYVAQELEDALGGIYSTLAIELQLPLVRRIMAILKSNNIYPNLPQEDLTPVITTGYEALGRGHDLQRLMMFKNAVMELGEQAVGLIDFSNYLERVALSLGLEVGGLLKTPEQMEQEAQAGQMNDIVQQTAPQVLSAAANSVLSQNNQG